MTFQELEQLWIQAGGSEAMAPVMAAIALAESGGCEYALAAPQDIRPVQSCTYRQTSGEFSVGLWQINVQAHPQYNPASLFNPAANARAAVAILGGGSPTPWSTYTNGAYLRYLGGGGSPGTVTRPDVSPPDSGRPGGFQPVGVFSGIGDVFGKVFGKLWDIGKGVTTAVVSLAESVVFLVHFITNPDNWLRLIEFLLGMGLILFAIAVYMRVFSSSSSAPSSAAAVASTLSRR